MYKVNIISHNIEIEAEEGENLLSVQRRAGLTPDAPCGGERTCGKCLVDIVLPSGITKTVKACKYAVNADVTIFANTDDESNILENTIKRHVELDPVINEGYAAAIDIGTTSIVCYMLDLRNGRKIGTSSTLNPQRQFGADVISRCDYVLEHGLDELTKAVRDALNKLMEEICVEKNITREEIKLITVVGNTCMHHLFLGIDPKPLTVIPYEAAVKDEMVIKASEAGLIAADDTILQVLPNIAGFVGADTIGCLLTTEFDTLEDISLMIDIGTNGEMVMGNRDRMIACSTAAGPAFEGAKIECGMRGMKGAIDHVKVVENKLVSHVISDVQAEGICGSGLLDAIAAAIETEIVDETGRIDQDCEQVVTLESGQPAIELAENVYISQKDIREVQLAKGAIAAGIELMADELGIGLSDIKKVMIAGAFGNYMDPHSACVIGMIPLELEDRIEMIGNAAGEGAIIASLNSKAFLHAQEIREKAEFLELASSPDFQDVFVDHLMFE